MKPAITITLIVTGTLLIPTPPFSNLLRHRSLLEAITSRETTQSIVVGEVMSSNYALGCWLVGTLAIASAVTSSLRRRHPAAE